MTNLTALTPMQVALLPAPQTLRQSDVVLPISIWSLGMTTAAICKDVCSHCVCFLYDCSAPGLICVFISELNIQKFHVHICTLQCPLWSHWPQHSWTEISHVNLHLLCYIITSPSKAHFFVVLSSPSNLIVPFWSDDCLYVPSGSPSSRPSTVSSVTTVQFLPPPPGEPTLGLFILLPGKL